MSYYFKVINADFSWPFGRHGPLVVNSGELVTLPANQVFDYSSISIAVGGVLQFTQSAGGWTILGCSGDATINGVIQVVNGAHTSGTFTANAPSSNGITPGEALSYSIVQASGGDGGSGGNNGGAGLYGNGGGGGGFGVGLDASTNKGGDGSINTEQQPGGLGAPVYDRSGTNGPSSNSQSTGRSPFGGGGGGASRGLHGTGFYLRAKGSILGSGSIIASGQPGGLGGNGGSATDSAGLGPAFYGGGGGGGAAGGSGGSIVLRYHGSVSGSLTLSVTGGGGGAGGVGGGTAGAGGTTGQPGLAGSSGTTGTVDSQQTN